MSEPRVHIVPIIPKDVRRVMAHAYGTGLTLIVTTSDGDTTAIGWSSTAEALKDVARILEAIATHPSTK